MSDGTPVDEGRDDLDPTFELPRLDAAPGADVTDNYAWWMFDEAGEHALLCLHLATVPGAPSRRREFGALALGDGRVLALQGEGAATTERGPGGAGAWLRCEDPFLRWSGGYRGLARVLDAGEDARGPVPLDGPRALVRLEFEAEMAAPPWRPGSRSERGRDAARRFVGGSRYEQLFGARVQLEVDGETRAWSARGLRARHWGGRATARRSGLSWQTARFPSGRAFGQVSFRDLEGEVAFADAFVAEGDRRVPARAVVVPWLERVSGPGERVELVLASELGEWRIEGEIAVVLHRTMAGHEPDRAWSRLGVHGSGLVVGQSMARLRLDGEETFGLVERSAPPAALGR